MASRLAAAQDRFKYLFPSSYGRPVAPDYICDHGQGIYLFDQNGKRYIDFSGGPHVVSVGHADPRVIGAMLGQMQKVSYVLRGSWLNEPALMLAERILGVCPPNFGLCQFCNSGSEATETAIKLAHQYHFEKGAPRKHIVISRWQSYHGMTLAGLSVSGHPARRDKFGMLLHGWPKIPAPLCYRCALGLTYPACGVKCARMLEETIDLVGEQYVSAFMAEPIGGAATGCMVPVPEYYPMIRDICDRHDVLFIDDEVICGFGRTGKWFGIEHWGVVPDIMISAKGMTGGYTPMSVVIIDKKIGDAFVQNGAGFVHGFTMEGNPVSAAGALAVIDIIQKEGLVARSAALSEPFLRIAREKLGGHWCVGDIRGKGLLMGIDIVSDRETRKPFDPKAGASARLGRIAMDKGVVGYPTTGTDGGTRGDTLLLSPPLIITEEQIDTAFSLLDEALTDLEKELGDA